MKYFATTKHIEFFGWFLMRDFLQSNRLADPETYQKLQALYKEDL